MLFRIKLCYFEIKNHLLPLVLLHAQGMDTASFKNIWGRLFRRYHVCSIDCYRHGERLHDTAQYNIEDDFKKVSELTADLRIIRFDCGHGIHIEKPKQFIKCLTALVP